MWIMILLEEGIVFKIQIVLWWEIYRYFRRLANSYEELPQEIWTTPITQDVNEPRCQIFPKKDTKSELIAKLFQQRKGVGQHSNSDG